MLRNKKVMVVLPPQHAGESLGSIKIEILSYLTGKVISSSLIRFKSQIFHFNYKLARFIGISSVIFALFTVGII